MERKPLARSTKPLKRTELRRSGSLSRSTKPIPRRSAETAEIYRTKRVPLVKKILEERPACEACLLFARHDRVHRRPRPSVDCHEIRSRGVTGGVRGTAWLDESNIKAVCRPCHRRIGNEPALAKELGLVA